MLIVKFQSDWKLTMRVLDPAPTLRASLELFTSARAGERLFRALNDVADDKYMHWDELRRRTPPEGLDHREWWAALKLRRSSGLRPIDLLTDIDGRPFAYSLPDEILRLNDSVTRQASGDIAVSELVTNASTRNRYVVSSLMEEAITSSQMEGAVTTRRVAKEMLRSGREPRDNSEQMIVNNYRAMERIASLRNDFLTPELVLELHRIVTDGTLQRPEAAGRLQHDQESRVGVWSSDDQLLHQPPPVNQLAERLERLCRFANGEHEAYVPPLLRAVIVHFMAGYDHYFEDGNGRTARALFYWVMLREGYWLAEFLTISTVLKRSPAKYGRSFLHTETDEGDLTYFLLYHLNVLNQAIDDLHAYLARHVKELQAARQDLGLAETLNHRQRAVIHHALENPGFGYTAASHARSHRVSKQTALSDLAGLADKRLLTSGKQGRQYVWSAPADLAARLRNVGDDS